MPCNHNVGTQSPTVPWCSIYVKRGLSVPSLIQVLPIQVEIFSQVVTAGWDLNLPTEDQQSGALTSRPHTHTHTHTHTRTHWPWQKVTLPWMMSFLSWRNRTKSGHATRPLPSPPKLIKHSDPMVHPRFYWILSSDCNSYQGVTLYHLTSVYARKCQQAWM